MVIDSFAEWAVIIIGIIMAIGVLKPNIFKPAERLKPPHPTKVRKFLARHRIM